MMRMGVGSGQGADSAAAGRGAARQALERLGPGKPDLVLVFASIHFDLPEALKGIREVTGDAPLLGCSTAGEIGTEGVQRNSIVAAAFALPDRKLVTAMVQGPNPDSRAMGRDLAQQLLAAGAKGTAIVFSDGLRGNGTELVRGIYEFLGPACAIAGGAAGDDLRIQETYQIFGDKVHTDSVAGVCLNGLEAGIALKHGFAPVGRPMLITKSAGNQVLEINSKPAAQAYLEYFGLKREDFAGVPFANIPGAHDHPLGIPKLGNEFLIRHFIADTPQGAIVCTGDMPQDHIVRIMHGTTDTLIEAAREASRQALAALGSKKPAAALIFNCASRLMLFGERAQEELDAIKSVIGPDVPMAGFYTYGEMGKFKWGQPMLHNLTLAVCLLPQ